MKNNHTHEEKRLAEKSKRRSKKQRPTMKVSGKGTVKLAKRLSEK